MAIITAGYDGTVDEVQFAKLLNRYSVVGAEDFKASTQPGDRIVAISDGTALGPGTVDVATSIPPIQFAVASGTRWDLVVLRRDWQPPGGATSIEIIEGGATKAFPAVSTSDTGWNRRPGIVDDQPLYLQQVNGTLLGTRIDLRCWASHGGLVAASVEAKEYLAVLGATVWISGVEHRYVLGTNDVPQWDTSDTTQAAADVTTFGPGFEAVTTNAHKPRVRRVGNMVHLIGAVRRTTGDFGNLLTVPAAFRPTNAATTFVGAGVSSNGIAYQLALANGVLSLPNGYATDSDTGAFTIFPVSASWPIS